MAWCAANAFFRQRPTNPGPSAGRVDYEGADDGPSLLEIGRLRSMGWDVGHCAYDVTSKFCDQNFAVVVSVPSYEGSNDVASGPSLPLPDQFSHARS